MSDVNITIICTKADQTAANTLAATFPGGAGTFSVPLSTTQGVTNPTLATHYAGSGVVSQEMADAFTASVDPMIKVFSNDSTDFNTIISQTDPVLYRIYEAL